MMKSMFGGRRCWRAGHQRGREHQTDIDIPHHAHGFPQHCCPHRAGSQRPTTSAFDLLKNLTLTETEHRISVEPVEINLTPCVFAVPADTVELNGQTAHVVPSHHSPVFSLSNDTAKSNVAGRSVDRLSMARCWAITATVVWCAKM